MDVPAETAADPPAMSVIIAARDEETWLPGCLDSLLAQDATAPRLQVIVAANACRDRTVELALARQGGFSARGWELDVLDLAEGGKLGALNAAESRARGAALVYLDADVRCDRELLGALWRVLDTSDPRYATGTLAVRRGRSWVTRAYADFWVRLPFVRGGAVGAGLFALNRAGRARWGDFPDIISDDTFVRLNFAPHERIEVAPRYHWPMVEGFSNLVRVRRRQDAGVAEVGARFPDLAANDDKARLGRGELARLVLAAPLGFAVYLAVHLMVRLRRSGGGWTRGR